MECPKCKWNNPDDAVRCANCFAEFGQTPPNTQVFSQPQQPQNPQQNYQQPPYNAGYSQTVPNYLVWSILATVLCCIPFGIVAIIKAADANSKAAAGDYSGAMASAGAAKTWMWVAFGVGLAVNILAVLAQVGSIMMMHNRVGY